METIVTGDTPGLPDMEIAQINSSLQRILIVEDNDDLRNYLVDMLRTGYNIQSCPNGKEALIIIREFNPDLVISDIMMPEMNGLEASMAIREMGMDYTDNIPIIAMTANAFTEDVKKCFEAKMSDHISKPIDIDKVTNAIYRLVHKSDGI